MSRGWSRTLLFSWIFPFWFSVWIVDYKRLPGEPATDSETGSADRPCAGRVAKGAIKNPECLRQLQSSPHLIPIHASILERTGERTHFREGRACLEELYAALSHHLLERQVILAAVHLFAAEADLAEEGISLY